MLTIRLQRRGRKNDPSFRVIVTESKHKPKTGKYLEMLGSYDVQGSKVQLNAERIKHWLSQGVTVSGTVHNLLIDAKILEGKKVNVLGKKTPPKPPVVETPKVEAAPAPVAETPAAEAAAPEPVAAPEVPAEAAPATEDSVVAPETPQA